MYVNIYKAVVFEYCEGFYHIVGHSRVVPYGQDLPIASCYRCLSYKCCWGVQLPDVLRTCPIPLSGSCGSSLRSLRTSTWHTNSGWYVAIVRVVPKVRLFHVGIMEWTFWVGDVCYRQTFM